jgi:hypothetical protein
MILMGNGLTRFRRAARQRNKAKNKASQEKEKKMNYDRTCAYKYARSGKERSNYVEESL